MTEWMATSPARTAEWAALLNVFQLLPYDDAVRLLSSNSPQQFLALLATLIRLPTTTYTTAIPTPAYPPMRLSRLLPRGSRHPAHVPDPVVPLDDPDEDQPVVPPSRPPSGNSRNVRRHRNNLRQLQAGIAAAATTLARDQPDMRLHDITISGGSWHMGDEVITEFDGIPLPQPPPFLTATLAALIPSYPPLLADLATEILTVDPTAREADIWTSVAGWTRLGPYGPLITSYKGVPLPAIEHHNDQYYGQLFPPDTEMEGDSGSDDAEESDDSDGNEDGGANRAALPAAWGEPIATILLHPTFHQLLAQLACPGLIADVATQRHLLDEGGIYCGRRHEIGSLAGQLGISFGNYASKVSMFTPTSRLHTEHSIAVEQFAIFALADSPDGKTLRTLIREHLKGKRVLCHCSGRGLPCHLLVVTAIANSSEPDLRALCDACLPAANGAESDLAGQAPSSPVHFTATSPEIGIRPIPRRTTPSPAPHPNLPPPVEPNSPPPASLPPTPPAEEELPCQHCHETFGSFMSGDSVDATPLHRLARHIDSASLATMAIENRDAHLVLVPSRSFAAGDVAAVCLELGIGACPACQSVLSFIHTAEAASPLATHLHNLSCHAAGEFNMTSLTADGRPCDASQFVAALVSRVPVDSIAGTVLIALPPAKNPVQPRPSSHTRANTAPPATRKATAPLAQLAAAAAASHTPLHQQRPTCRPTGAFSSRPASATPSHAASATPSRPPSVPVSRPPSAPGGAHITPAGPSRVPSATPSHAGSTSRPASSLPEPGKPCPVDGCVTVFNSRGELARHLNGGDHAHEEVLAAFATRGEWHGAHFCRECKKVLGCTIGESHRKTHNPTTRNASARPAAAPVGASTSATAQTTTTAPNQCPDADNAGNEDDAAAIVASDPATTPAAPPTQKPLTVALAFFDANVGVTGSDLHHVASKSILEGFDSACAAATAPVFLLAANAFITDRTSQPALAFLMAFPRLLCHPTEDDSDIVDAVRYRASLAISGDVRSLWFAHGAPHWPHPDGTKTSIADPDSQSFYDSVGEQVMEKAAQGAWADAVAALDAVPSAPPTTATFTKLQVLQPTLPIDPELGRLRDSLLPHLADGETVTATWGDARGTLTAAAIAKLADHWSPVVAALRDRVSPDGTGWRNAYLKRLLKYARSEIAIILELISTFDITASTVTLLGSDTLIGILKADENGSYNPDCKLRPIGKQNAIANAAFKPLAQTSTRHAADPLANFGMVVLKRSGTESVPRQLQIMRDRYPHCILRSEDAANAFPSGLRFKVLEGLRLFREHLLSLPSADQTDSVQAMLTCIVKLIKYTVAFRSRPNNQWVNVNGKLLNLLATGACVQGGILDMPMFCIMYTFLVLVPLQEKNRSVLALSIADDLYTAVKNETPAAHEGGVPPDIEAIAKAAHDFIALAWECNILANVPKVHMDQPDAAAGTAFDLAPHLHLFPKNPNPTPALPAILPLTRDGFKVAGAWQGPPRACAAWFHELVRRLRVASSRLTDKRLTKVTRQVKWNVFRMCYRVQAKLTNAMRAMVPSDIEAGVREAAALQHSTVRSLLDASDVEIPDAIDPTNDATITLYRLHLSTNYSGAAIANPELTCPIAHLGAASSTLDNLARNRFLADLTDPLCWAATEIPHLVQADHTFGELTTYPAFYEPPAVHADIYRAFISSLTSADGTISIANLGYAAKHHPQGQFAKILNKQLYSDTTSDTELSDLIRASMHAGSAFNARRWLVPLFITRDNRLNDSEFLTNISLTLGLPLTYISDYTRCTESCTTFGPARRFTVPGMVGNHFVTSHWHRSGSHQQSCKYGKHLHSRHNGANGFIAELAKQAGAAIDPSETMVSATDNQRIDLVLWHPALGTRGVGIDTCVWNEYTLARIARAARDRGWVLRAAEKHKVDRYEELCDASNLDFRPCAMNPDGGFGDALTAMLHVLWEAKVDEAKLRGIPVKSIRSQQRRLLEKFSVYMARGRHRAIYQNLTGRRAGEFTMPDADEPDVPPDDDLP